MSENADHHHPILDKPWTYQVIGLACRFDLSNQANSELDLVLQRDQEVVTLRFGGVHGLEVEDGFPYRNSGMEIIDVSGRGMEAARIRVSSFEQDPTIHFWARSVERVEDLP